MSEVLAPVNPILIVEDDAAFRQSLEALLKREGYAVEPAALVAEVPQACARKDFSLVISDVQLPDGDGLDVQDWFTRHAPGTPFALITARSTVAAAVEAMKRGALDYLEKPLRSPAELLRLVRRTIALGSLQPETASPPAGVRQTPGLCGHVVARDERMLRVLSLLDKIAPTPLNVLLLGESGVGKEAVARCLHAHSRRAGRAFVAVDCAALDPRLAASRLFGPETEAFPGAPDRHPGAFERAHRGTLFLDGISELDPALQQRLLRVIDEKKIARVDGGAPFATDVRIVAATSLDIEHEVTHGKFSADLYCRLSAFPLEIPPLRERPADLDTLAERFTADAALRFGKPDLRLSEAALYQLRAYSWPGNASELESVIERAAALTSAEILPEHLPFPPARGVPRAAGTLNMRELERRAIEEALGRHNGNRTHTARELGISLRTLQYRLKEYGIGS